MRAAIFNEPHSITVGERPDAAIMGPTDAVVRVVLACVCGSDLWYYRGESPHALGPIGHEFIGHRKGRSRHRSVHIQRRHVRPLPVPGSGHSDATLRSLLTLSDVMCTGHHAAVSGGVRPGTIVAVVGDGAVGLCAVIAACRLGAARVIALSRNPSRQEMARSFGATDIVAERGDAAVQAVLELTGGIGVDGALECVGTGESMATAFAIARPGSVVGAIGAPHGVGVPIETVIFRNVGLRGGVAPVRRYIPELLDDVLEGRIHPGRVFDFETDLDHVADAYAAMDERRSIKSLVRVSA